MVCALTLALSHFTQFWFDLCIKAFVILFCYINSLPIPWRVPIAVHVFGTLWPCWVRIRGVHGAKCIVQGLQWDDTRGILGSTRDRGTA